MDKVQGEGNYEAARIYDRDVTEHAKDQAKVRSEAEEAKKAVEGDERAELEDAEAKGKSHSKA